MFESIAKELRSRKLITPRHKYRNREEQPYIAPRMRWP
jgi:hypothetical protein